jgi:hypothetical protein
MPLGDLDDLGDLIMVSTTLLCFDAALLVWKSWLLRVVGSLLLLETGCLPEEAEWAPEESNFDPRCFTVAVVELIPAPDPPVKRFIG